MLTLAKLLCAAAALRLAAAQSGGYVDAKQDPVLLVAFGGERDGGQRNACAESTAISAAERTS